MESGSSMPLAGFVILLLLLWLNGIFYGFSAAVHNLSENEVEKRAQEGDKKAVFLLSRVIGSDSPECKNTKRRKQNDHQCKH